MLHKMDFAEDHLPNGQEAIQTSSVIKFQRFMRFLTNSKKETGYTTMGLVTGGPGLGKTVAIQAYVDRLVPRPRTALPPCIKIKVPTHPTPKSLAKIIVSTVKDKPRGTTGNEAADEAAEAIYRNELELLITDEADRLNDKSFELLRYIHDKSGCPIAIVGLPRIMSVIQRYEKFSSRVGLHMKFEMLETSEMIDTVFPNLIFPHWKFAPKDEQDCELGKYIWTQVRPSLRKLRNLLQNASMIAKLESVPIGREIIDEAFRISIIKSSEKDEEIFQDNYETGEFEYRSEIRNEARRQKRRKKK